MHLHHKILAGVSVLTLMTGAVLAQVAPPQGLVLPAPSPVRAPQTVIQGAPQQPASAVTSGADMPAQPPGGFETDLPTVGAEDPANTMNLDNASGYVDTMTGDSNGRLSALTGATVSDATASDLEEMMRLRRSNMVLELKNSEAELAVRLWGTLYNNEHAQAMRTRKDDAAKAQAEAAQQAAAVQQATIQGGGQVAGATSVAGQTFAPVMVWPVVSEVNGGTAVLLVPDAGEVYARAGTVLAGGMTVVSVGSNGVVVDHEGQRVTLGFGTALAPSVAPVSQVPAQPMGMAQPIGILN